MQNILDNIAVTFANTAMKHSMREEMVEKSIEGLSDEQAERFMAIAFGELEI